MQDLFTFTENLLKNRIFLRRPADSLVVFLFDEGKRLDTGLHFDTGGVADEFSADIDINRGISDVLVFTDQLSTLVGDATLLSDVFTLTEQLARAVVLTRGYDSINANPEAGPIDAWLPKVFLDSSPARTFDETINWHFDTGEFLENLVTGITGEASVLSDSFTFSDNLAYSVIRPTEIIQDSFTFIENLLADRGLNRLPAESFVLSEQLFRDITQGGGALLTVQLSENLTFVEAINAATIVAPPWRAIGPDSQGWSGAAATSQTWSQPTVSSNIWTNVDEQDT